jgi:hypothetical protein
VAGEVAPSIAAISAAGVPFDSRALAGRAWLLSFHRYAT